MDILKVGHHGLKQPSPELLIPLDQTVLISAGIYNLYGHPHTETLKRLEKSNTLITQIEDSISLKDGIFYTTAR